MDQTARKQIYNEMKSYFTGISDEYLRTMTSKVRKINKLFGFEYDPVTLKKINDIGGYMIQRITCSANKISRFTNSQIQYIIDQFKLKTITSHMNKISETMATTSTYDSDDNFSDTSDVTNYFKKEEGTNESTEEISKMSEVCAPTMPISASPSNSLEEVASQLEENRTKLS